MKRFRLKANDLRELKDVTTRPNPYSEFRASTVTLYLIKEVKVGITPSIPHHAVAALPTATGSLLLHQLVNEWAVANCLNATMPHTTHPLMSLLSLLNCVVALAQSSCASAPKNKLSVGALQELADRKAREKQAAARYKQEHAAEIAAEKQQKAQEARREAADEAALLLDSYQGKL